jgi:poly(hydroxyalkanoate) depolymerase family esterase
MFETLPHGLREASRLTGAGRLLEATAAIQRMLGAQTPALSSATRQPEHVPPTIDGTAGWVDGPTASRFNRSPVGLGSIGSKAAVGQLPHRKGGPSATLQTGQFLAATFTSSAGSRPYKLYVPSSYRADRPAPLIVMLHGCTQSPDDFAAGTRMNEVAELRNMLVAYPGQTSGANMQKCWNWFNEGDQKRGAGEPSLIAGITRKIMADWAVKPKQVYVAGLSAGGAAAAIMGKAYPDLYAAVGVHSGLACGAASSMQAAFAAMRQGGWGDNGNADDRIVPVIVFHGDRDRTVNPRNGDCVIAQLAGRAVVSSRAEEGKMPNGHSYHRTVSIDESGRSVAEQWVIHGASHAWAGGNPAGSYTDPHGPSASEEMVRFFMEHPHFGSKP